MKLIFLDIDGVLNNAHTRENYEDYTFVEDSKIELLKQIIDATGAQVVLTSTWRYGWYATENVSEPTPSEKQDIRLFYAFRKKLQEFGIELLSYTEDFGFRGEEIDKWLSDWDGEPIESFVILDDLDAWELQPYADRLVHTAFSVGLTEQHVRRAIELLNREERGFQNVANGN